MLAGDQLEELAGLEFLKFIYVYSEVHIYRE